MLKKIGPRDKKAPGQPSKLEDTHRAALAKMIDEGPINPSISNFAFFIDGAGRE